jgi:hypothetical protein
LDKKDIANFLATTLSDRLTAAFRQHSTYADILGRIVSRLIMAQRNKFRGKTWYNYIIDKYGFPATIGTLSTRPNVSVENDRARTLTNLRHKQALVVRDKELPVDSSGVIQNEPLNNVFIIPPVISYTVPDGKLCPRVINNPRRSNNSTLGTVLFA